MLKSVLAGEDGPGRRALPVGEFLQGIPLGAVLLLVANDWWLKPSSQVPSIVTGKLSDLAGLLFFPLLLTALVDVFALGLHRLGVPVDFSLRRYKVAVSIGATALCFALVKLDPRANMLATCALQRLGLAAHIVLDPTDLAVLLILWLPWRIANREIAGVPLGRLEYIESLCRRRGVGVGTLLDDTIKSGADPKTVEQLAKDFDQFMASRSQICAQNVERGLQRLREHSAVGR